ncbi:MAG: divergent polysaccharide deacetylase family protein [Halioglobus sp.]
MTQAETSWPDANSQLFKRSSNSEPLSFSARQPLEKNLVIIIDDIGHHLSPGKAAIDLPGKLNIAILPYTPHAKILAERAHLSGKEIMLHTPMSTIGSIPLGRGGLTTELSEEEFRNTLAKSLEQIPHVRGINNHMGSDLTQRRLQMGWVMEELQERDLYFVDSRTSHETVAANTAEDYGVPNLSRQVFLDNERSTAAIADKIRELLHLVDTKGMAVAIGHPYPETIRQLREMLPSLEAKGIKLAYVSELFQRNSSNYSLTSIPESDI